MKTVIVVHSISHGNTAKVAQAMASLWGAEVKKPAEFDPQSAAGFDHLSLGSGIFFGKHHQVLLAWAERLPPVEGKKATIFSTGGNPRASDHAAMKGILESKGHQVVDEFRCVGFDTYGPFKLVGGIQKGHPNETDLEAARAFARKVTATGK
jgi:flavodoxin